MEKNPASKWEEDTEIHGLTLFDIHRKPRKLPGNPGPDVIFPFPAAAIDSLLSENLKCGVCLGFLDTTLATTCLHRFCSECLQRSLRMDLGPKLHHECPACRAKLASRRASKPDVKFDKLVEIFAGFKRKISGEEVASGESTEPQTDIDLKKYRDIHKQNIGKFREMRAQKLLAGAARSGGSGSTSNRRSFNSSYLDSQKNMSRADTTASANNAPATTQNKVWLKLQPIPEWTPDSGVSKLAVNDSAIADKNTLELLHPFLRVPPYKNIFSLKNYLLQKLGASADQIIVEVCGIFKNKMTVLEDALTVLDMTTKAWDVQSELVLYFRLHLKKG